MDEDWQIVRGRIVRGHRVASGLNGDPRFPGGTLSMQAPHFLARGLDLSRFHFGTINTSIAPHLYRPLQARFTLPDVKWHDVEPAETFSFFDVRLIRDPQRPVVGFIYYPHPETKPEHFQAPDVLELLLPFVDGLSLGLELQLAVPRTQMVFE